MQLGEPLEGDCNLSVSGEQSPWLLPEAGRGAEENLDGPERFDEVECAEVGLGGVKQRSPEPVCSVVPGHAQPHTRPCFLGYDTGPERLSPSTGVGEGVGQAQASGGRAQIGGQSETCLLAVPAPRLDFQA